MLSYSFSMNSSLTVFSLTDFSVVGTVSLLSLSCACGILFHTVGICRWECRVADSPVDRVEYHAPATVLLKRQERVGVVEVLRYLFTEGCSVLPQADPHVRFEILQ